MEEELITKLIYTKSKIWDYEDEYSLSLIHKPDVALKFNSEALTAIYFGCKTSTDHEMQIIDIVTKKYPNAEFRKFELDKESFKLTEGEITLL